MAERGVRNDDRELTGSVRDELPGEDELSPTPGEFGHAPADAGRTSGGGSLGHKQPEDVAGATNIRNQPSDQRPATRGTMPD